MESEEASIDAFIGYIKTLSLHIEYVLYPLHPNFSKFKETSIKVMDDFDKFVTDYNQKRISEIKNTKLLVPLSFYRSIAQKIEDPDFMNFQYRTYGLKYVFTLINLECSLHVEIWRKTGSKKSSYEALEKLEDCFLHYLSKVLDEQEVSCELLQKEAEKFLPELFLIVNGEKRCLNCKQSLLFHPDLQVVLPPTIRLEGRNGEIKYSHEICM